MKTTFRILSILLAFCLGSDAFGQKPTHEFTDDVSAQAQSLIDSRASRTAFSDAEELLKATKQRRWNYRGTDGALRFAHESYGHMAIYNDEPWVVFANRRKVPLSYLEKEEQALVERIGELIDRVDSHFADLVREHQIEASRQQAQYQREAELLDELERQRIEQTTLPRLIVTRGFTAEMPTRDGTEPIEVVPNQQFTPIEVSDNEVLIPLYGDSIWVPKNYFAVVGRVPRSEVQSASFQNSSSGQAERQTRRVAIPDVEPPKLDVDVGFYRGLDGALVEVVTLNGEGYRIGLRQDDIIERVNDRPIASLAEMQTAMRAGNGSVKLHINRQGIRMVKTTSAPGAGGALPLGISYAVAHPYGGASVVTVSANSVGQRLNIARGTLILSVNSIPIVSPETLYQFNSNPVARYEIEVASPHGLGTQTIRWPE